MRWAGTTVGLGAMLGWCGWTGGTGCSTSSVFICADDGQCEGGRCEGNGYCSFPTDDCASGWVYAELAAPILAGTCVGDEATSEATGTTSSGSGGGEPSPTTSTDSGAVVTSDTTETTAGKADASSDSDSYPYETFGYRGACEAYAMVVASCTNDEYGQYVLYYCLESYMEAEAEGSPCFDAFVDQLACLSALDCKPLLTGESCALERDIVDEVCPPGIG